MKGSDVFTFVVFILMLFGTLGLLNSCIMGGDASKQSIANIPSLNVSKADIDKAMEDDNITVREIMWLERLSKANDRRDFIRETLSGKSE